MNKINNLKYITAISVVVMLAVAALTVACFAFTGCAIKDNASSNNSVTDGDGNILAGDKTHEMPSSIVFAATTAETQSAGLTINATIEPATAIDKSVDWSVAWVAPSSGWATGKSVNSYLAVTPASDGSTTATVKCLAPFGAQIKVTATSRANNNASAYMTVDYGRRITSAVLKSTYNGAPVDDNTSLTWTLTSGISAQELTLPAAKVKKQSEYVTIDNYSSLCWTTLSPAYTYDIGSVDLSISSIKYYLKYSNSYVAQITIHGFAIDTMPNNDLGDWCFIAAGTDIAITPFSLIKLKKGNTIIGFGASDTNFNEIMNALRAANGMIGELKAIVEYANGTTSELSFGTLSFSQSSIGNIATSINLSQSSILF